MILNILLFFIFLTTLSSVEISADLANKLNNDFQLTLTGDHSQYFNVYDSKVSPSGTFSKTFKFAPKNSTSIGLYQLKFLHNCENELSKVPPLYMIVNNTKIRISTKNSSYEVPNRGWSLPIIFSFNDYMPESDVTITGQAISYDKDGNSITSPYVSFVKNQQTLQYIQNFTISSITFTVTGQKYSTDEEQTPKAYLEWTLSGTNAASYEIQEKTPVSVIGAPTELPVLLVQEVDPAGKIGHQTIYASCSQAGYMFYIISQSFNDTKIEYSVIKNKTQDKNIQQTSLGSIAENSKRTIYGYQMAFTPNQTETISVVGKLQADAKYYLRMYCLNQVDDVSAPQAVQWTQASNEGKPLIITVKIKKAKAN